MTILLGILEQGIIYGIMAMGVYITYKILDFPDLTVDGSFPLGAAVTVFLITKGVNPYLTLVAAFVAGGVAGIITGVIHVKFRVRDLLSGIIMMTALYTINLRIAGVSNVPIFNEETIFDNKLLNQIIPEVVKPYQTLIVIVLIALIAKLLLDGYLKTKSGYLLRAAGDNSVLVTSLAKDCGLVKIIGLALANALVALAGSVMCQEQRFFEITMGTGTIVIGLASVIIGINLFTRISKVKGTTAAIVGATLYKACVAIAISFGLSAIDMKLVTAILFLVILIISTQKKRG